MRIKPVNALRIADLDRLQHGERAALRFRAGHALMALQRLDDLPSDGHDRVQRILWVLQDHGNLLAAQVASFTRRHGEKIAIMEGQLLGGDLGMAGRQAHDRPARLRLAGSALADNAEPFATKREGNAAHRLNFSGAGRKGDAQVVDRQKRPALLRVHIPHLHCPASFGSSASRRPSPSRLKPRLTIRMATPGMPATHH